MENVKKLTLKLFISALLLTASYMSLSLLSLSDGIVAGTSTGIAILVPQVIMEELSLYDRLLYSAA